MEELRTNTTGAGASTSARTAEYEPRGGSETGTDDDALIERLSRIKHKVLVLSGKGGVGKSSVAACLAVDLAGRGKRVGLLDIDIHGPSIPRMLDIENGKVTGTGDSLTPVRSGSGVLVMSIGLLLRGSDAPVIWRGPLKYNVIRQFLRDVEWGELDYLIVDSPPGTGDEPLSVAQLINGADGALIVTTPQDVSTNDVRRSIGFSRQLGLPILGVVENMSGFICPECGARIDVFGSGGGSRMASELGCTFLGRIPMDPAVVQACDTGLVHTFLSGASPGAGAFREVADNLVLAVEVDPPTRRRTRPSKDRVDEGSDDHRGATEVTNSDPGSGDEESPAGGGRQRIAVPTTNGKLAEHFGHCETFEVFETDGSPESVERADVLEAPPHQPGLLPGWLSGHGVNTVLAGGMGTRARDLFQKGGIEVVVGSPSGNPADIVRAFVAGTLKTGRNVCDH
jgi:ATP-binding protein involved in chromosome partitioning